MKKSNSKLKKQIEEIKAKLCESIKYIEENQQYLKEMDQYTMLDLHEAVNITGFSLVQTRTLADFYQVQEFCQSNNLSFINHNF